MLLSKYKREPEARNKHVGPYYESEATSSSATDTTHPFRLIPWLLKLDSSTEQKNKGNKQKKNVFFEKINRSGR